jgi:ribosomal protein RSM22 (predicted rRNA methylase)
LAYAVARMPATYAAVSAALSRLREVVPELAPQSLLDVGAGTGAAGWAALSQWPQLSALTMLDPNPALRGVASQLAQQSGKPVHIIAGDLLTQKPQADLVIASYLLVEMPEDKVPAAALALWRCAVRALVLVEPGTPAGFARLKAAREALIACGAHVAAPCTHDLACPLKDADWCHFSQRLARSRDHMILKKAQVPFEDERYCYLVLTHRQPAQGARILAPPLETKAGLTFKLCDAEGVHAEQVGKRAKEKYRSVRRKGWGDLF